MNRCLKLSVLVALALGSAPALALDLGQIQVKSALDRPLVADIPLRPDHPGELNHVEVTLAPAAAFARAGISRANLKVPLTFKVMTNKQGQKVIRVTSTQPVREPYLDFLIQVSWPEGKVLREYTVLLDPLSMNSAPSVVPAKAPPAQPANAHQINTHQNRAAPAPAPAASETASSQSSSPDVYGPVQHGDTLSHIAQASAINGVSYQQMLIALKAANPDAFFRDNINALKSGAILRIPTRAQALEVTRQAAIATVRKQNASWQSIHATAPTMVASAGGSSAPVTGSSKPASGGDRLHLLSPEAGSDKAGAAGGSDQATVSALRQDLARSKEALSSQKQASADLKSRVAALEQIADKNKRLLGLKNAEIAELQQKLSEARKKAGLPALPASALAPTQAGVATAASSAGTGLASAGSVGAAAAVAPTSAASTANATSPAVASTVAGSAVATAKDNASAQQSAAKAAPSPAPANPVTPASTPWYTQLWARVGLAIIIVLLLVWMILRRRKPAGKEPKPSLADEYDESRHGGGAAAAVAADESEDTTDELSTAVAEDDGEEELLSQLAEHPDNVGLHLELASLYYARRDVSQFEGAAEAMHAYVDDESRPEWQEVVIMGREMAPDHPLFAQADSVDDTSVDTSHEFVAPVVEDHVESNEDTLVAGMDTVSDAHADEYDLTLDPESEKSTGPGLTDTSLPDESECDALPPLPSFTNEDEADAPADAADASVEPTYAAVGSENDINLKAESESSLATSFTMDDPAEDFAQDGFSDDPVDTKLDLARAYMDMGDHDGARAMLTEALREGSQMQQDAAQKLLDEMS